MSNVYNLDSEVTLGEIVNMIESQRNQERIRKHTRAFQITWGNQRQLVEDKLALKFPESYQVMNQIALKISRKINRKLARVYANGVKREVLNRNTGEVDEELTNLLTEVYSNTDECDRDFNDIMSWMNRYVETHEYAELFMFINEESIIGFKPLPQQLFTALPNKTKTRAEVIVFQQEVSPFTNIEDFINEDNTTEEYVNNEITGMYTIWSKEKHLTFIRVKSEQIIDDGETSTVFRYAILKKDLKEASKNPYGIMNFTGIKNSSDGAFYPDGSEVPETSLDINVMLSDIISIAEMQGYGQAVLYYDTEAPPQLARSGPTHVISIPNKTGNSKFDFANANADLDGHLNIILSIIRLLLTTNDLSTDKVSGELSATQFASAIDRLIADSENITNIEDQRKKYVTAEKVTFKKVIVLLKVLADKKSWPDEYTKVSSSKLNSKDYELRLTFSNIKPLTTEKDQAETIEFLYEKDFITEAEKHQRFDPNLTDKQAQARASEITKQKTEKAKEMLQSRVQELKQKLTEDRAKRVGTEDKPPANPEKGQREDRELEDSE